jgi:translation initiation factor IF-2
MTVDENEVRAGNAAGQAAAAISLPAVAWQQAAEEPEPQGKSQEESEGRPAEGAVAPGPAPEAAAEPEPSAVPSGSVPAVPAAHGETGTDTGADAGTDSEGEDAPESTPGSGTQASSDADGLAAAAAPAAQAESRSARRLSKPMIAAAATSGVVLMGVPLVLSHLGGGSGPGPVPPRPAGYNRADGGPGGFVPRADTPEKGSSAAGKGPRSGVGAGVGVSVPAGLTPTSSQAPGTGRGAAHGGSAPTTAPAGPGETTSTPKTPATQAPAAPAKPKYSAVAGPNCASTGASFTYSGWYTDGKEGWQKYGSGGYAGSGCNGGFFSLPMSGKAGSDAGNSLRWIFRTGAVTSGTCQVSVHIPSNTDIKAVGGKPSYYTVHAGTTGNDPILRTFNLDQPSLRGQWVSAGGVHITGGVLTVKLHDRGLDWSGSRKTYAHHAGDAARVQCTAD